MVPADFRDFFTATGQISGALIGLLFVAIQLSPVKAVGPGARVGQQLKAAVAFSALIDTLFISLAALLPATNLGEVAAIVAAIGLSSTTGLVVLTVRERGVRALRPGRLILPLTLFAVYVVQLYDGLRLMESAHDASLVGAQAVLIFIFFAVAIARAWELVGAQDTGLVATVGRLAARTADPTSEEHPPPQPAPEEGARG